MRKAAVKTAKILQIFFGPLPGAAGATNLDLVSISPRKVDKILQWKDE